MDIIASVFLVIGAILLCALSGLLIVLLLWFSIKLWLVCLTIPQRIVKLQNNETYNGFFGALANSPTYMNVISLLYMIIGIIICTMNAVVYIMAERGYFGNEISITITIINLIISFIINLTISTIIMIKLNSSIINKILAFFSPFYALYIAFSNAGINGWRRIVAMILALLGFANYIIMIGMTLADPFLFDEHLAVQAAMARQVEMARSDITGTLKAVPARIFAENLDPTASAPDGFASWSEWIIDTGGLDRGRWDLVSSKRGIVIKNNVGSAQGGGSESVCGDDPVIWIDTDGNLNFEPANLNSDASTKHKVFCDSLKDSYPSGSNRVIPLATTGAVQF